MCLLKDLQDKKEEAYQIILDKYGRVFFSMAYKKIQNYYDAQDCVQEIYMKIFKHIGECRSEQSLVPWLFKVANNHIRDFCKKTINEENHFVFCEDLENNLFDEDNYNNFYLLLAIKTELSEEEFTLLSYSVIADLNYKQISEIMNIPQYTVRRKVIAIIEKSKKIAERIKNEN